MLKTVQEYDFFKKLRALPFVEKIILYGSRARGDYRDRSDFDIALVCPMASKIDWFTVLDIVEDADTLFKIDCVRFDELSEDSPLKQSIESQGVVVYERKR